MKILQGEKERIDDFEIIRVIGNGNFSTIYLAEEKKSQNQYALKMMVKAQVERMHKESEIAVEKHCLEKLKNCEGVVQLREYFENRSSVYFLMQLVKGREL